ncbi:MAG: hypothetical protein WDN69_22320 [Aliidongia sp.]
MAETGSDSRIEQVIATVPERIVAAFCWLVTAFSIPMPSACISTASSMAKDCAGDPATASVSTPVAVSKSWPVSAVLESLIGSSFLS